MQERKVRNPLSAVKTSARWVSNHTIANPGPYALATRTETHRLRAIRYQSHRCSCHPSKPRLFHPINAHPIACPTFHSSLGQALVNFASIILFPPIPLTFSTSSHFTSSASTSSPPPMLFPLISTFGTVLLPVLFSKCFCSWGPKGWLSSSTTKGAGTIVYFSSRIDLALRE